MPFLGLQNYPSKCLGILHGILNLSIGMSNSSSCHNIAFLLTFVKQIIPIWLNNS